jgi:hypothetical protein
MQRAPRVGARLLRNNSGAFKDSTGRWVFYGLGATGSTKPGSSDLVGPTTIIITPDMVGLEVAVFTAVECKAVGRKPSDAQTAFLAMVRDRGGIACVAYNVNDFLEAVDEFKSRRRAA